MTEIPNTTRLTRREARKLAEALEAEPQVIEPLVALLRSTSATMARQADKPTVLCGIIERAPADVRRRYMDAEELANRPIRREADTFADLERWHRDR